MSNDGEGLILDLLGSTDTGENTTNSHSGVSGAHSEGAASKP